MRPSPAEPPSPRAARPIVQEADSQRSCTPSRVRTQPRPEEPVPPASRCLLTDHYATLARPLSTRCSSPDTPTPAAQQLRSRHVPRMRRQPMQRAAQWLRDHDSRAPGPQDQRAPEPTPEVPRRETQNHHSSNRFGVAAITCTRSASYHHQPICVPVRQRPQ
jgi:hypothetical protein